MNGVQKKESRILRMESFDRPSEVRTMANAIARLTGAIMKSDNRRDKTDLFPQLDLKDFPAGVDRRAFLMRTAMIGSVAVLTGCSAPDPKETVVAPPPAPARAVSPDLDVVKKSKGPVMTTIDEFYKVGPGPSSSHTIGPMRITYDFYQRCTKLPADQLAKATGMKVHLFGSLSATGKGHGTERAALAGIIGKEPATVDPLFLDSLRAKPDQTFPVKLGDKSFNVSLKDIIYDAPKGDFPHPNTMICKLMGGDSVLFEQEYYSVGGGFIEWKGYQPPKKGQPKYPYSTMKELLAHADANKLSVAQVVMANEVAVSGKSEAEIAAFVDKIANVMVAIVKSGLKHARKASFPAPSSSRPKRATSTNARWRTSTRSSAASAWSPRTRSPDRKRTPAAISSSPPRPADRRACCRPSSMRWAKAAAACRKEKIRNGLLAGAAVGYLCKHNATLAAAEGGCQAEIGVASAMGAALIAQAHDQPNLVIANAAESALQHHLGMTCDPVAGLRPDPVHRALRVRRRQGVDRFHDRQQ